MLKKLTKNRFFLNFFANLVFISLWIVKNTSSWKGINEEIIEEELKNKKSVLVLIWHNQLMGSTFSWKFKPKLRPIATSHRDGQLSILVQKKFGLEPLLREKDKPNFLIKQISQASKNEDCIYITPDAPHGPRYKINTNIYKLALKYDMKIAILSFKTNKFFRLNNWDKLKIPLPFSKGIYLWGKEIIDPKKFRDEENFNKKITFELNSNKRIINEHI
tara:strand:+ start:1720 stop:2373 length:654 start_codon:yes stop_codon:yes gene_type:complete